MSLPGDPGEVPSGRSRAGRPERRRSPVLSVIAGTVAVLFFVLFVALGTWQVERRAWKLDLITRVEQRVHAPPAAAPGPAQWPNVTAAADEYRHVSATGTFLDNSQTLVQAVTDLGAGYWVLTPLRLADGSVVLVNRGFVAADDRERVQPGAVGAPAVTTPPTTTAAAAATTPPATTTSAAATTSPATTTSAAMTTPSATTTSPASATPGAMTLQAAMTLPGATKVTGLLRMTEPRGGFLRHNDPGANRWYSRDVQAIAASHGLTRVAPFFIDAETVPRALATNGPGVAVPVAGLTVITFHNSHLVYAITWYTLALMVAAAIWLVIRSETRT